MRDTKQKTEAYGLIPIKPHLKKFVHFLENIPEDGSLDINSPGSIPFFFRLLLEGKTNLFQTNSFYDIHKDKKLTKEYSDTLRYKYTSRMQEFERFFLSSKSIRAFNLHLHRLFVDFLLIEVRVGISNDLTEKKVLHQFFSMLDIEPGNTIESIKRALTRARDRKKIPTIYRKERNIEAHLYK